MSERKGIFGLAAIAAATSLRAITLAIVLSFAALAAQPAPVADLAREGVGWGWDVDLVHLAGRDTLFAGIVHGVLTTVVILLLADVLWHAAKAAIDGKLAATADLGQPNTEEARRRARLHTLLPIFRNVLFVLVIAVAAIRAKMMTLPGEQFVIRRKAYAMIKEAFDENGIKFAFPTVQLAGEGEASAATAAIAQRTLELTRPAAA